MKFIMNPETRARKSLEEQIMSETEKKPLNEQACVPENQKVYVLEGEPDEVFDEQGNRLELTPEQVKEIEKQIGE